MTSSVRRRTVAVCLCLLPILAACDPSDAARGGDITVPVSLVDTAVRDSLTVAGIDLSDPANAAVVVRQNRADLNARIRHAFAEQYNRTSQTPVSDADVTEVITQAGLDTLAAQFGVTAAELPSRLKDAMVLYGAVMEAAEAGTSLPNVSLEASVARYESAAESQAAWADAKVDPAVFETVAEPASISLQLLPDAIGSGLFSAAEGSFIPVELRNASGESTFLVFRVEQRQVGTAPLSNELLSQTSQVGYEALAGVLLSQSASPLEINPRYGVWDPDLGVVVPGASGL